jgi:histidinol-phosphate aminotransferase
MTFRPVPQPGILEIEPYVPGASKSSTFAGNLIRLAANESPFGASPHAIAAYKALSGDLHRYPDGGSVALREALAQFHGIEADRIVCGTGSDEIITLICRAFAGVGDEVLYGEFGFLMYPIAALACGATPVKAPEVRRATDLQSLLDHVTPKTKIVFLANPNNPTGSLVHRIDLQLFRQMLRQDIILVVDSAYAEYVTNTDYTDGKDMVQAHDNVIMLRTFSKVYGLSALRVGWSYSSAYIADILNRVRGVFNINSAAQACAVAALADQDFIATSIQSNWVQRQVAADALTKMGIKVYPGAGNFLLMSFGTSERAAYVLNGLKDQGILLRGMTAYNLPDCIRMTIGRAEDMPTVLKAIEALAASAG